MASEARTQRHDDGLLDPEPDWVVGYEIVDGKMQAMDEARYQAFIKEGLDDIDAGRIISHEEVMRQLDQKLARKSVV